MRGGHPLDSRNVCEVLDHWLACQSGLKTIAVYSALPGEVDLSELVKRHVDRSWVYPRVAGNTLTLHVVRNPAAELVPGAFGILEPSPTLSKIEVVKIDAFLCPGLAFDGRGGRLGRGRGYYDRLLTEARPGTLKVGVCFANQIVSDTYQEPHDVRMDVVISA